MQRINNADNFQPIDHGFVRCSKEQREFLEHFARGQRWTYKRLVEVINTHFTPSIKDIGQLSYGQADELIRGWGGRT